MRVIFVYLISTQMHTYFIPNTNHKRTSISVKEKWKRVGRNISVVSTCHLHYYRLMAMVTIMVSIPQNYSVFSVEHFIYFYWHAKWMMLFVCERKAKICMAAQCTWMRCRQFVSIILFERDNKLWMIEKAIATTVKYGLARLWNIFEH